MNKKTKKVTVSLDLIKPYWRNARIIDEKAVKDVAASIEKYGYNQLIIVDKENVIIAGHVRYKALRQLGYTDVDVFVADLTKKQAKQYRIADNKTSEAAFWDTGKLIVELENIGDDDFNESVFPDINIKGLDDVGDFDNPDNDFDIADVDTKDLEDEKRMIAFTCPYCDTENEVEY